MEMDLQIPESKFRGGTPKKFQYKDFDSIMEVIGGFGKFQKLTIFLIILPALLPVGFFHFNVVFMSATPDAYGCTLPTYSNLTMEDLQPLLPKERRGGKNSPLVPSRCAMYDLNYTNLDLDSIHFLINDSNSHPINTVSCDRTVGFTYSTAVYESTTVTDWDLVCDNWDVINSLQFSASTIGGLWGAFLFAFIADRCGRKPAFYSMVGVQVIFGAAAAFVPSSPSGIILYLLSRVCVGMCTSFIYTMGLMLAVEITGVKTRALMSVLCSIGYSASVFVLLGIAYFVRSWRGLALASSLPLVAIFALWKWFPESPRWYLARKRYDDLEEYVRRVARVNGVKLDPDFDVNLPDILRGIDTSEHKEKGTLLDLFRTPNLRKKTLLLAFINFCNNGIFTGLNLYAPAFGADPHWNAFLANVVELPPYIFAQWACDRCGRRLSLFYPMLLCAAFCLATAGVAENAATAILVLSLAAKFCITFTFLVGELYEEEIFPTVVRGQGHSFTSVISQLAGIGVPFVVHLGNNYVTMPLFIFGVLCAVGAVAALFLPETVYKELPQTLQDGETFGKHMPWKAVLTLLPGAKPKHVKRSVAVIDDFSIVPKL